MAIREPAPLNIKFHFAIGGIYLLRKKCFIQLASVRWKHEQKKGKSYQLGRIKLKLGLKALSLEEIKNDVIHEPSANPKFIQQSGIYMLNKNYFI